MCDISTYLAIVNHEGPELRHARPGQTLAASICFGTNPKTEDDPHVTQESGGKIMGFNLAEFSDLSTGYILCRLHELLLSF